LTSTVTPTYWLLDALTGWRTGSVDNVSAGDQLTLAETDGRYATSGRWISASLDGRLPGCQWHRLEVRVEDLPAGSALRLATYTSEVETTEVGALPDDGWSWLQPRLVGAVPRADAEAAHSEDFLIASPPGRYLWVLIAFSSDGYETPSVGQLVVHYPRTSYLRYLPAVFSANDAGRSFLERFLSIPQTEWDGLREQIATIARYFDPRAVPEGAALAYLASWLDAQFEPQWSSEDQRRLLCLLPQLRGIRGTARAVHETARVYLQSIARQAVGDAFGYPYLIEGFRERNWFTVAPAPSETQAPGRAAAPPRQPGPAPGRQPGPEARVGTRRLWGADVVRRFQLGGTARAGHSRLVSVGDPGSDMFRVYAHRVRALAPAGWIRTAGQQRLLERGLRLELPAHVAAEVTLLEPHFQADVQATLGIDTVAGPMPTMRLCSAEAVPPDLAPAPAQRPRGSLGYDTVLAGATLRPAAPGSESADRKEVGDD
jgi:phage tail-like protein